MKTDIAVDILFNGGMAFYFAYSFFFPVQTNNWLSIYGYLPLMFDIFLLFILMFITGTLGFVNLLANLKDKRIATMKIHEHPKLYLASLIAIVLLFLFTMNFVICYILLVLDLRFYNLIARKSSKSEAQNMVLGAVAIVLGLLAAILMKAISATISGQTFQPGMDLSFIAVWGFVYFAGLLILSIRDLLEQEKIPGKVIIH